MPRRPDPASDRRSPAADALLDRLAHPLAAEVATLRDLILAADPRLTEGVKWNAPSYAVDGDDRLTFQLRRTDAVRLVFHRGAKASTAPPSYLPASPLLAYAAADRAIATFSSAAAVRAARDELTAVIRAWLAATCATA